MAKAAAKNPVRWGVISTARIGWEKVLPGMMKSKDIEIRAIASRGTADGEEMGEEARHPASPTARTRSSSTIPRSRRSTIRCPITCMSR